jgi:hypothetical protein
MNTKAMSRAEFRAEAKAKDLQDQIEAIREFFERRGLDWATCEGDVRGLRTPREAAQFLVDLATAADMPAFLRERFAH